MLKLLKKMQKREIIMACICIIFVLGQIYFDLTLPDFMSDLTVLIQTGGAMSEILNTGLKMLGCVIVSAVLSIACGYLAARCASGFTYTVREKLFNHVVDLSQEEMNRFSVPSLITRTTNDITQIQMLIAMGLQMLIKAPIMAVWAVMKILGKSWELSVVTGVFVVIIIASVFAIICAVVPRVRIVQKLTDKINRIARENLTGINVVHAFNAEDYQNEKFDETNTQMMKTQLFNQRCFAAMQPIMMIGMNGLSLAIYWVGAALLSGTAIAGRLTLFSDIVVFSTYATYVVMSFMMLIMIFMMYPAAQVSAERIGKVFDAQASIKEGNISEKNEKGTLEFRNVSFRYPDAAENDLEDINFKVNRGETLAIIGATGSGKTTLVSLIARFYDATDGEILVDDVNIKEYSFDTLYNILGYVTQKAVLFSGSIEDNVAFGEMKTDYSSDGVDRAIQLAQASEFVEKLEDGKKHNIAQGGKNVSGGQKQRISIARALARKPEILVFDDSFSALDYRTDAALRTGLEENLGDTTRIIVAQRISTIRHADKILVLEDGKIVGNGKHEELMTSCEVYREIAMSQLSESELK